MLSVIVMMMMKDHCSIKFSLLCLKYKGEFISPAFFPKDSHLHICIQQIFIEFLRQELS